MKKKSFRLPLAAMALLLSLLFLLTACNGGTAGLVSKIPLNSGETFDDTTSRTQTDSAQTSQPTQGTSSSPQSAPGSSSVVSSTPSYPSHPSHPEWEYTQRNPFDYQNIPKSVKDKGVKVLMWREYTAGEKQAIAAFEKVSGMKITTTFTTEAEYTTKLFSMIINRNSPDACAFSASGFPATPLKGMNILDETAFRPDHSDWDQKTMAKFKLNGHVFGVTRENAIGTDDRSYVTYYLSSALEDAGITTTPYDLYKAGKWNWETQAELARQVGYSQTTHDIYMLSAGADMAEYDGKSFTNHLTTVTKDDLLTQAWYELATLERAENYKTWNLDEIRQGKIGLFTAPTDSMFKEVGWFDDITGGYGNLQAVPVAGPTQSAAYTPCDIRLWGSAKGAKNTDGAAYFLHYFLDHDNVSQTDSCYNEQLKTVYRTIAASSKMKYRIGAGIGNYYSGTSNYNYNSILPLLIGPASLTDMTNQLQRHKNTITAHIVRAEKDIGRLR